MSGSTSTNTVGATGQFQIANSQIIDPYGAVFNARGINLAGSQMGDANQILADFPGLNFIRLAVVNYASPDAYKAFINTMTSSGVVVELEDQTSSTNSDNGGSRGVAYTGTQLSNELNWYSSLAQAYASNPYVWFGTDNEPPVPGISPWQQATYDAIRSTGNNSPIMVELPGGGWPNNQTVTSYGMDPNVYAGMSNIIGDLHLYGWSSLYNPDQSIVNSVLADMIQGVRTIPSLNGTVPVIVGEYGPSTEGAVPDANANQVIQAVQQSTQTSGAAAFAWNEQGPDSVSDGQGNLTSFGQEVAQWIAYSVSPSGSDIGMSFINGSNSAQNEILVTPNNENIYVLPAAGNEVALFTSNILDTGGILDLRVALAATDWNAAPSALKDYISVTDTADGAVISMATTFDGPGTEIAAIPGATNLDFYTLLAHAWTLGPPDPTLGL